MSRPRGARPWPQATARAALLGVALVACRAPSPDVGVPPADSALAEPQPLSGWATWAMDRYLAWQAWRESRSGFIAMLARDGRVVHASATGWADIANGVPMRIDTPVRMASMTKPITAVAAHILIEDGRLALDHPVARYVPAFAATRVAATTDADDDGMLPTVEPSAALTVRHLLQFTAGLGGNGGDEVENDLDRLWTEGSVYAGSGSLAERIERLASLPLYEQPGTSWRYGASADVLARVVEVAAGEPFDAFLSSRIFEPLGMEQTHFLGAVDDPSHMARVYTQDEGGDLVLVDAADTDELGWTPGGSGLVSTAADYMRFALMLWNEGSYDGTRILAAETVRNLRQPHVASGVLTEADLDGIGWGLGMAVIVDADATPIPDRNGDFWWAGYYGTTFFVSPETGLVGVILSQNEPSEYSGLPVDLYVAQGLAFAGL